jgi:hypothetical protein
MANYCTLSELKQSMRITDNVDNSLLTAAIESASIWVDGWCDRDFTVAGTATSRDYIPTGTYDVLQIDDATEVVSVKIDDDLDRTFPVTLRAIDFQTEPLNDTVGGLRMPIMRIRPFEDGYWPTWKNQATVRVEARYGWPAVPASVKQATILQASRVFTRLDSPLGVAGFGDMGAMRVSRFVDPDVEMLLAPYRRMRY